ncbi:uncharacterized protein LOC125901204 isoform X2 [Epinephelus fuscoguttatus]|uniref:uncharacterized protein LOC125901204 isoform X2 n=1 Tax=Epinephelus fuscoguttatus TaxID=293821 RepID=UPI0020D02F21|nr:uncharacterized protein LOC125901204 isoform X2 [Epinephelus fuscoguttatus]
MASPRPSRSNSFVPDIKEGSVHNTTAKSREGSDSNVSFKDDRLKENILNFNDRSPCKNLRRAMESRGSCESGVSVKSDRFHFIPDYRDRSPLKLINHECSPARSTRPILNNQERSSHRSLVEESPSAGISCASVKRDNSQGRIANVKDTLPAPKEKSDFCIFKDHVSDDEDLVKSSDDQTSVKSGELSDSSLSFKSDRSKDYITNFNNTSPPSQDLSTSELEDLDHNEESDESSDDDLEKTVVERGV